MFGFGHVNERVVCEDGFTMSVQAGSMHYCTPRSSEGPYTAVEVGFPSQRVEALMPYAETRAEPTKTVYERVPSRLVVIIIADHGGMVSGELPDLSLA